MKLILNNVSIIWVSKLIADNTKYYNEAFLDI